MRLLASAALTGAFAAPAFAGQMTVNVEIPRLNVAEYHRPYVAIWVENADQTSAGTLAVWYDVAMARAEGTTWLKDMRQWWRREGRALDMPVDGISGATRPPGRHDAAFAADHPVLAALPPGEYSLAVEAAREVGGRELIRIPFTWPPAGPGTFQEAGEHELGAVSMTIEP
ncbi:DUF2271 domain-containing protein [Glycocaulis profundi]|nr:DUF2271 domain-containing protein [Glycocaulis profundi]